MRIGRRKRLVIAAVGLVGALLLLITSSPFQQWLLRQAENFAAKAGFPFSAARLRLDYSELKIFVDGVVYDQNGQKIQIEHLNIDFPWDALRGGLRITSLEADGVIVDIQTSPVSSSASTTATAAPTKPRDIRIDRLAIRKASLSYSTPNGVMSIPSLSIEATDGRGMIRMDAPASLWPDTNVTMSQIPFELHNDNARFGPASWELHYAKYRGSGSAQGVVRWAPSFSFETNVTTDPITIEEWKDIHASGTVSYANGVLGVSEFRVVQGGGEVMGSARVSDSANSATIVWQNVNLNRGGVVARTDGTLKMNWQRSDFSDLSGEGRASVQSRQYGALQADVRVEKTKVAIDVQATSRDLVIKGQIATGLDPLVKGNLREFRGSVRGSIQPRANGAFQQTFNAINVSGSVDVRDNVLTVKEIQAKSNSSRASNATFQINLTTKHIAGRLPEAQIDLRDLTPDMLGTVNVSGEVGGSIDRPAASFTAYSAGLDVSNTHIGDVRVDGTLVSDASGAKEIRAQVNGTVHPLDQLKTSGSLLQGFASVAFSAAATFRDSVLTVQEVQAHSTASTVSGAKLQMNVTDKRIRGEIPRIQIDLRDVAPDMAGTLSLSADIDGTIDQPAASFMGNSDGVDIGATHIDRIGLEGKFERNSLFVTRLDARQDDGSLSANGYVNLANKDVRGEGTISDLKIVQVADLSATAFLKARVDGTYESPNIDFHGELRNVIYRQEEHGSLQFSGATDLKKATVRARSDKYRATVAGEVAIEPPYIFTAELTSTESQIRYGEYSLVADGRVRVTGEAQPFKPKAAEFEMLKLRGEGVEVSADGSTATGTRVNLQADLSKLPIEGMELGGTAQVVATVSGDLNDPSIEGALTTADATIRTMQMSQPANLSAQVDFTGGGFSIRDLQARFAGATATVKGNGSWQGAGQLQFRIADIRPENFAPGRPVSGMASIEGELDIKSPRLESISGHIRVTELEMTVRDESIRQTQPIEAELDNQVVTVRHFQIEGEDTHATVTGYANLHDGTLNLDADAEADLAILEPFIPNGHPAGRIVTRAVLRGTTNKPEIEGFVKVSDGELAIEQPDVLLSNIDVDAQLHGDRIEVTRVSGMLNGGTFQVSGGTALSAAGLRDAAFQIHVERGQLEYPEGLQSEFSSELRIDGSMPNLTLRGNVDVLNAIYQKDFNLTQEMFARITSPQQASAATPGISDQIRLEVEVQTPGNVVVKNNVADLEASGNFRIRGTVANPIILGRARVLEGGQLYFGPAVTSQSYEGASRSDRYAIERGAIDFNNPLRTEPTLDFLATHELDVEDERYLITLEVTGTPPTVKADLTSDPHLEQSDIVAMLLTGRTLEELQGSYASVAGEQALGYVSGRFSERVLSQAGQALGLNTVRVDPVTVANQTDLAARLTLAKEVTTDFGLVYSQNLSESKAQTWIVAYKPTKNFVIRAINDAEQNEALLELKHELRFGGGAELVKNKPKDELKLREISFSGTSFPGKDLQKQVTKEGKPFSLYHASQDVRNLRRYFATRGFPAARIQAQQSTEDHSVDVTFDITEGPRIVFVYEGATVPESVQTEVQQRWAFRSSPTAALRDSTKHLLRYFRSEGYLQAQISTDSPAGSSEDRRYVFKIAPGAKFDRPSWVFRGIEPMEIHEPAGLVMENPEAVKDRIESELRGNGYLDAQATIPGLVINGSKAHFEINVDPGKPYNVQSIEFEGNQALDDGRLRKIISAEASKGTKESGSRFTSAWLETARQSVTSEYWKLGFNDVQIVPSTSSDPELGHANVRFAISENESQRIATIEITGATITSKKYIERQFEFKKGDPVDHTKINLTRKKLYDTRLFQRVSIEVAPGTNGYAVHVHVVENAPWKLRYGLAAIEDLDDGDRHIGVTTDFSYNNLLGKAITVGASGKLDPDERDARVFGSVPQLYGRNVTTSLTVFLTRDSSNPDDIVDYWGTTLQQQWRLRNHYILSYDYSYRKVLRGERTDGSDTDEDSILDDPRVPIARFNTTILRDTRNDMLDAKRGRFFSNSFEVAPPGIGSSIEFFRNYTQYFRFDPVKKFVFASAIRFGFVKPFEGQELDPTLQFEAGGGTTVRAFKQDELTTEPGNYVLILNHEFRFPLLWKFSGVTFIDAGQVTNESKDIFHLRWGPGLGLRLNTPFIPLRTDIGINVDPRSGESRIRWSFGIGQAF
jgi:outer membrane protein assembly factor BamA/autotransporter translocation and assembly factor TamB